MAGLVAFATSVNFGGPNLSYGCSAFVPSDESRARVKRCLFSPRSADEAFSAQQAAIAELKKLTQHDSSQWNFDFENDQPKSGRFSWTPYRRPAEEKTKKPQNNPNSSSSSTSSLRQAHITDFLRPAKRSAHSGVKTCSRDSMRMRNAVSSHVVS